MPPPKPANEPEPSQVNPPSIEYCKPLPFGEVAVIVIVPSSTPQSVGCVEVAETITGATLSSNISHGPTTSQVPLAFLTMIQYVPPAKPVNVFDDW